MSFSVTAILAAYNEEDIVGAVISHLVAQGVDVYFIDHGSTDSTLEEARRFEGRGVIGIEQFPAGARVLWADVLRRKEELARDLAADWFIHHDADEFRESPWCGTTLLDGIRLVDSLGYNAIDFELLQFQPTHDEYRRGDSPLETFPFYESCKDYDRLQIKCWKKAEEVSIAARGGHDVDFAGRRIFPIRFLLRHYPIRSQAQGERKVFRDRIERFADEEYERGWHRQYVDVRPGESFLRSPKGLTRFDAEAVRARLSIEHRGVEELRDELGRAQAASAICRSDLEWFQREWPLREAELVAAYQAVRETESLRARLADSEREAANLRDALRSIEEEVQTLRATIGEIAPLRQAAESLNALAAEKQARIDELLASWSWRGTALARAIVRNVRGY